MSRRKSRPNAPLSADQATDLVIDAGLLTRGRIEKVPSGLGYDAVLPVEDLGKLAVAAQHYVEANDELRRQRDVALRRVDVLLSLLDHLGVEVAILT